MAKRYKKQLGGLLSGLTGGNGLDFLSQIGSTLGGFSNEPALKNIFSQSDTLFNGFKNQLSEGQFGQLGGEEKLKPIFDLISMFGKGHGIFEDGGEVNEEVPKTSGRISNDVTNRLEALMQDLRGDVVEYGAEAKKEIAKDLFNFKYGDQEGDVSQIIPGMHPPIATHRKGSRVSNKVRKMMDAGRLQAGGVIPGAGIPIDPMGQYNHPGQPVMVPSPDGLITMAGVMQDLLAIDENGNKTVLPANSGVHQLNPGMITEIPIPKKRKRGSHNVNQAEKKPLGSRLPTATSMRYHRRNRKQTQENRKGQVGYPFGRKVGF